MSPAYEACGHQCRHHKDYSIGLPARLWYVAAWSSVYGMQCFRNVLADSCDEARWICMERAPRWRHATWVVEPVHGAVRQ